jgi:tetratricopeptide (TPR) repeat protein
VVEGWLHRGLQNEPTSTHLQLQMAELRDLQGRYPDVINMYRSVLNGSEADQWQKAVVKNNLAFVLAMSAKTDAESQEALKLTKEAIEVLGPTADLLDTQAMVYLAQNNAQHAVNDLHTAIGEDPAPTKYFHLALAELGSGNRMGAREALRKAKESNFDTEQLSILERKNYEKLERDLGAK